MNEIKILPPEELYGQLFYDVMSIDKLFGKGMIFNDSKDFSDCIPKLEIKAILEKYSKLENRSDIEVISNFINENFQLPGYSSSFINSDEIKVHILKLWSYLKRGPDTNRSGTLIPLKYPYIVPGGRFREIYYWDTYFAMLGLEIDEQDELIRNIVDNFSDLIDKYGFIPNGNRTYYLSRSQPPFYSSMIELLSEKEGSGIFVKYLKYLEKEYNFWMNGADKLDNINSTYQRVVWLNDGEILNRYYDNKNTPRPEMYRADIETASRAEKSVPNGITEDVFRNLRAAAESGWDFSSRWLSDISDLSSILTTEIIPVDLNSLLYKSELTISKAYRLNNDFLKEKIFKAKAEKRRKAITKYCWNRKEGFFMDYNFRQRKQSGIYSLAGVYPLFFKIATDEQAILIAKKIENSFLNRGGVVTTLTLSEIKQQWDYPNGWAPLQWVTIKGLRNYGMAELANKIKFSWLSLNEAIFTKTHKMLEKYDVVELKEAGGGEYPNQDGFGWTNGVYQRLSKEEHEMR